METQGFGAEDLAQNLRTQGFPEKHDASGRNPWFC